MNWKADKGVIGELLDLGVRLYVTLERAFPDGSVSYAEDRNKLYDLRVMALRGKAGPAAWAVSARKAFPAHGHDILVATLTPALYLADEMAEAERKAEEARRLAAEEQKRLEEEAAAAKLKAEAEAAAIEAERKAAEVAALEEAEAEKRREREKRRLAAEKTAAEAAAAAAADAVQIEAEKASG